MKDYKKHFEKVVTWEKENGVATIKFVCPQNQNMMNEQWVDEYGTALKEATEDDSVRVIVLKGEGDVFIGTGDAMLMIFPVMMQSAAAGRKIMHSIGDIVRMMYHCPQPIIAAVDGLAAGGGCGITLSSDIVIASNKAVFDETPFGKACLPCDSGGLYSLERLVGQMKAKYLALRPEPVKAQEALELGMVAKVVPSETLYDEVYALANYIASMSAVGVSAIKSIANRIPEYSLDTYLQVEAEYISNGIVSDDFKELATALAENRTPVWTGK
jgi:enoyl-CoA hydratase/carnithine racemase